MAVFAFQHRVKLDRNWRACCGFSFSVQSKLDEESGAQVAVFAPHVFLPVASEGIKGSNVQLGAQNMYIKDTGAFTGAVAGSMVKSVGATHVSM